MKFKFVKMVPIVTRDDVERALWVDEATGQTIVTSYNDGSSPWMHRQECMAFYADEHGEITDYMEIACALEPEAASLASTAAPIHVSSLRSLWHVAAIRQIEARKAE